MSPIKIGENRRQRQAAGLCAGSPSLLPRKFHVRHSPPVLWRSWARHGPRHPRFHARRLPAVARRATGRRARRRPPPQPAPPPPVSARAATEWRFRRLVSGRTGPRPVDMPPPKVPRCPGLQIMRRAATLCFIVGVATALKTQPSATALKTQPSRSTPPRRAVIGSAALACTPAAVLAIPGDASESWLDKYAYTPGTPISVYLNEKYGVRTFEDILAQSNLPLPPPPSVVESTSVEGSSVVFGLAVVAFAVASVTFGAPSPPPPPLPPAPPSPLPPAPPSTTTTPPSAAASPDSATEGDNDLLL